MKVNSTKRALVNSIQASQAHRKKRKNESNLEESVRLDMNHFIDGFPGLASRYSLVDKIGEGK